MQGDIRPWGYEFPEARAIAREAAQCCAAESRPCRRHDAMLEGFLLAAEEVYAWLGTKRRPFLFPAGGPAWLRDFFGERIDA